MSEQTSRMEMVEGDITTLAVGAIGNAASETLLGGGGGYMEIRYMHHIPVYMGVLMVITMEREGLF